MTHDHHLTLFTVSVTSFLDNTTNLKNKLEPSLYFEKRSLSLYSCFRQDEERGGDKGSQVVVDS